MKIKDQVGIMEDKYFNEFIIDYKERILSSLKNSWEGKEYDGKNWIKKNIPTMNDLGIEWARTLIGEYFNSINLLNTTLSFKQYNNRMRIISKYIIQTLNERYKEFNLDKDNIDMVAKEIESRISTLLSDSMNNGYRVFYSSKVGVEV